MVPQLLSDPFTARLRDLLSTLEVTALVGVAEERMRGLGEHLRFACMALPCSEALVALEVEALGRLSVPVVADEQGFRASALDLWPSGTPFAYLLAGGSGLAVGLAPEDAMVAALRPALAAAPAYAVFVPIRLGSAVVGGAALFSHRERLDQRHLEMAERLSEVLALTVESFRTERVIFELFARALPDLIGPEAPTSLGAALQRHLAGLRAAPAYRRRLELATAVARVADRGPAEAELCAALLDRIEAFLGGAAGGPIPRPSDEAHARGPAGAP
jgi:hypothetical protein